MGKAVSVSPSRVVVIGNIRRGDFFQRFPQIPQDARFVFNGGERSRGAGTKKSDKAVGDARLLYIRKHARRNVDDVAEAFCVDGNSFRKCHRSLLFGDCLCDTKDEVNRRRRKKVLIFLPRVVPAGIDKPDIHCLIK